MKKGQTNNPNGRPKGSPNKKTKNLFEIAERLECNPFEVLLHFTKGDYQALGYPEFQQKIVGKGENAEMVEELTISPELRQKSAKDACEYLFPKRRSVEVKTDFSNKSDEELLSDAAKLIGELSGESRH